MKDSPPTLCNIYGSSTEYFLKSINNAAINDIFNALRQRAHLHDAVCNDFFNLAACFYVYRACDPNDDSQLVICKEVCHYITRLYKFCVKPENVMTLINIEANPEVKRFWEFALEFICTRERTYALQDLKFSESCLDFNLTDIFPGTKQN